MKVRSDGSCRAKRRCRDVNESRPTGLVLLASLPTVRCPRSAVAPHRRLRQPSIAHGQCAPDTCHCNAAHPNMCMGLGPTQAQRAPMRPQATLRSAQLSSGLAQRSPAEARRLAPVHVPHNAACPAHCGAHVLLSTTAFHSRPPLLSRSTDDAAVGAAAIRPRTELSTRGTPPRSRARVPAHCGTPFHGRLPQPTAVAFPLHR